MGATMDTGNKKSLNVHLNIVPFIDLMSCLTAFLLVTAVWSSVAQISIKPKGLGREVDEVLREDKEEVRASVLIQNERIWVGLSRINEFHQIPRKGGDYDWSELETLLLRHKASSYFAGRQDIEVAAEDEIAYQTIISTMDVAIAAGFSDVGLAEPNSLSARPIL
ncbi:MAG: biopolymer transporter ExbD [Proteobacteria bacterium]|nr:biopolymer transporter ExbD [Pseudomonadota bacterium]